MQLPIKMVLTIFLCSLVLPRISCAESTPPGPFEQAVTTTIPAGYSELLGVYDRSLGKNPVKALKEISKKLDKYNKIIGRFAAVLDVGGKLYAGDLKGAAQSGALTALGELASTKAGEAFLDAMGLTTLPVTTFIVAVQIWQASESALQSATIGRQLESLYGSIESDPFLKVTERALGTGDPIPVTKKNVEHVWRKILMSKSWRELFKAYVTSELGQTWPEASYWESWTLPGNNIEDAALFENQQDYKGYIAGLLRTLNDLAKKRESAFLMRKYISQLQSKFQQLNPEQVLRKYVDAIQQLPKVKAFIHQCPQLIKNGLKDQNLGPLITVIENSKNYAINVLAFLPTTGPLGEKRTALMAALQANYSKAWAARNTVMVDIMQEAESVVQSIGEGIPQGFARASTGAYHAQRVPFTLTISELQQALETEYLTTGKTDKTQSGIDVEYRQVTAQYQQQKKQAEQLYAQMNTSLSVPEAYTWDKYENYRIKLSRYKLMDQLLYEELIARVRDSVETLEYGAAAQQNMIFDLYSQVLKEGNNFLPKLNELTELLTPYGLQDGRSLPNINYVGLSELSLPLGNIDEANLDPYAFTFPILKHIDSLETTLLSSIGDYSNSFINDLDKISTAFEHFSRQKTSIKRFQDKLKELSEILLVYKGPQSDKIDPIQKQIEDRIDRIRNQIEVFVKKSKNAQKMQETTKSFMGNLPSIQRSVEIVSENLQNDLSYLERLKKPLNRLGSTLFNFRAKYQDLSLYQNAPVYKLLSRGHYSFNPEVIAMASSPPCSTLDHSPTLMTPEDIKKALQNLHVQLQKIGMVWLDRQYNIELSKFVDLYVSHSTILDAQDPGHYQFINVAGRCGLHFGDEFDALREKIAALRVTSHYPEDLSKLKINGSNGLETLQLNLDLDNHLEFAKGVVRKSWDPAMATSIQALINIFAAKRVEYFDLEEKEAYFQGQVRKFGDIAARYGSLVYDTEAVNDGRSSNDEMIQAFEMASAMQPTVEGFLAKASIDSKLTPTGQKYFSILRSSYKSKFDTLNEMLEELKLRKQSELQGQPQAAETQKIKAFYASFRQAYESKSESQVMSYIDDDWTAAGGVTLLDLEDNLRNMYNVFDDIEYNLSGLSIRKAGQGLYNISYNVTICGVIFDNDLTHEEVSSVREQVIIDRNGQPKIFKTLGGNYWSVQ